MKKTRRRQPELPFLVSVVRRTGKYAAGDKHPRSKLTWTDVRKIRASREKARVLAEHYEVSVQTVHFVRQGRIWRDDPNAA